MLKLNNKRIFIDASSGNFDDSPAKKLEDFQTAAKNKRSMVKDPWKYK